MMEHLISAERLQKAETGSLLAVGATALAAATGSS